MNLIKYVPAVNKKRLAKIAFILLTLVSVTANYWLVKQVYNLRCSVNGQTVGYFVTDVTCGELSEAKYDALELAREKFIKESQAQE